MTKSKKTFLLSITCGLISVICIITYTYSVKQNAESARVEAMSRYGGEQLEICVSSRDIAAGETIDSACIDVKMWIADLLPEDAVRNSHDILGKQTTSSIIKGEVISNKRFQDNSISLEVPAGLSAVSVPAKDVSAVGGAISAGMHIDVYSTGNTSTTIIAQNVQVLATNTSFGDKSSSSQVSWITLAVEPSMVQELVSASQKSTLYFVIPSETKKEDSLNSNNLQSSSNKNLGEKND